MTGSVFCEGHFSGLVARCTDPFAGIVDSRVGHEPFGQDPAFNPTSQLFDASAVGNPGLYYNTSPGSPEISALGNPYGFFPVDAKFKEPFSVVLPVWLITCSTSPYTFSITSAPCAPHFDPCKYT